MSSSMQAKLLRVLQDRRYMPVGATAPRDADVRVIAATHRNLRAMVEEGSFREDLYFRLHVLVLRLPALRDRAGDLPLLLDHFLHAQGDAPRQVSAAALECLERYPWPGNVRELRAEVERWGISAADALVVEPRHLSTAVRAAGGYGDMEGHPEVRAPTAIPRSMGSSTARSRAVGSAPSTAQVATENAAAGVGTLAEAVEALERTLIERGLERTNGNRTQLAKELDISRTTLADRLKRYGLDY